MIIYKLLTNLPIANGIINKPTKMSLTARLTISIFDAVRNFRTRQTESITTRFPNIVKPHIKVQRIIIIIKYTGLRVSFSSVCELFVVLINSLFVVIDNQETVTCIDRRFILDIIVDVPFVDIIDNEDGICCCCCCCSLTTWTAATDESNEKIDKHEINIDVRLE